MPSLASLQTPHQASSLCETDLPISRTALLDRHHQPAHLAFRVAPSYKRVFNGTGLATCCPSVSPFGLPLGPALPWADQPSPGTLGLSVSMILAYFALLMPTFSLLFNSQFLSKLLRLKYNAPLPIVITHVPELRCYV